MESMIKELFGLSEKAGHVSRQPERVCIWLRNLSTLAHAAAATEEASDAVPLGHEAWRVRKAEAEFAAAKLELAVKQSRAEWRGFVRDVEELLASLEAAPLLSVCPD